jgi:hypothetical protein
MLEEHDSFKKTQKKERDSELSNLREREREKTNEITGKGKVYRTRKLY